jgi:MFS family permease
MDTQNELIAGLTGFLLLRNYDAGERVPSERELAVRFNVGRGNIREALSYLEALGIIERRPKSGGAPTLARRFALTPARTGAIMAMALFIAGLLGPVIGGPLTDLCHRRGGPRRTMTAMFLLSLLGVPAALFGIMPDTFLAGLALTLLLTVGFTINVMAYALVSIVIPGELRGLYIAVTVTAAATVGLGVAPLLVSTLSGLLGGREMVGISVAIVCIVTSLVGAAFFGFGGRYFPAVEGKV